MKELTEVRGALSLSGHSLITRWARCFNMRWERCSFDWCVSEKLLLLAVILRSDEENYCSLAKRSRLVTLKMTITNRRKLQKTKTNEFPWQGGADSPGVAESPLLSPGEKIFYETKGRRSRWVSSKKWGSYCYICIVNCPTRWSRYCHWDIWIDHHFTSRAMYYINMKYCISSDFWFTSIWRRKDMNGW